MSLRGNWRTTSVRIDCRPPIRIKRVTTIARTGRRMKRSVNFTLAVLRLWVRAVCRLDAVVDDDCGTWAELERAGGDDLVARFHAADDRDLIAARAAQLHELLADA